MIFKSFFCIYEIRNRELISTNFFYDYNIARLSECVVTAQMPFSDIFHYIE